MRAGGVSVSCRTPTVVSGAGRNGGRRSVGALFSLRTINPRRTAARVVQQRSARWSAAPVARATEAFRSPGRVGRPVAPEVRRRTVRFDFVRGKNYIAAANI